MNLRGEVVVPDDFIRFFGSTLKNAMTVETDQYSISFGDKSIYDRASEELFQLFAAKSLLKEKRSYLHLFLEF